MFKGSIVALVTPFDETGEINFNELERLIEWHISEGTDGFVILGTTGESATLSDDERIAVVAFSVQKIDGRVPVIAGSGSNNLKHALFLSTKYEELGVDGLLVVTPYYNKGNDKGIFRYFEAINNAVNLPIMLYNVPSRTGYNLNFNMVKKLKELSNVCGIKEASGDMSQVAEFATLIDDTFNIYSGNDDQVLPVLALGGIGVVSACANVIPNVMHKMVDEFLQGNIAESRKLQLDNLELINTLFIETNPIPAKKALFLMGYQTDEVRLPLSKLSTSATNTLKDVMANRGLL